MLSITDVKQLTSFDWIKLRECDMDESELDYFWRMHSLKEILPIPEAIDGVYSLSRMNKVLHVITARNEHDHKKDTGMWIQKYFPEIHQSHIHFANHHSEQNVPKYILCQSYGITLMIDDGLHNAEKLAENGIECILLDKPWNQTNTLHPKIHRVKDWSTLIEYLK